MHKDMSNVSKREKYVSIATSNLLRSLKAAKMHGISDQATLDRMTLAAYLSITSLMVDLHDRDKKAIAEGYLGHSTAILGKDDSFSKEAIELIRLMHLSNTGSSVYPVRRNSPIDVEGTSKGRNSLKEFDGRYANTGLVAARQILYGANIAAGHRYNIRGSENFTLDDSLEWLAKHGGLDEDVLVSISGAYGKSLSAAGKPPRPPVLAAPPAFEPLTKKQLVYRLLRDPCTLPDRVYAKVKIMDEPDAMICYITIREGGIQTEGRRERWRLYGIGGLEGLEVLRGLVTNLGKEGPERYIIAMHLRKGDVYFKLNPNGIWDKDAYRLLDIRHLPPPGKTG
ncbi:hypothetical protein HYT54_02065 [Candidatus Woesearchaeota archaeon]|nr:hypothetical protein [Candidatus Woesearchaeota archaeon]